MANEISGEANAHVREGLFQATQWSVVLRARDKSEVALNTLCHRYRQPLLIWLKNQGYTQSDAEDLVQGFFEHLLSRDFLANVHREKGAFRTFLLKCLKHYMSDQRDRHAAVKRGGGVPIDSLEMTDEQGERIHDPAGCETAPDLAFDRAWAQAVLTNALLRLQQECSRQGHATLYAEIEPVMFSDETASPYHEIAIRLAMTEGAVKTAAHRIRARLKGLIREEILQTVTDERDWQQEVGYLIGLFER